MNNAHLSIAAGTPSAAGSGARLVLKGLPVSAGIAVGPAHIVESGVLEVPDGLVDEGSVEAELRRFEQAVAKAGRQLKKLKAKAEALPEAAAEDVALLLDARAQMLASSHLLKGVEDRIRTLRENAALAVCRHVGEIAKRFQQIEDDYLASRVDDIREVGNRLIRNLVSIEYRAFRMAPEGCIVLAEEITPADTALMDPKRVAGFAAALGGSQSHTSIMARSLGLPAVLGAAGLPGDIAPGETVIIDGARGLVIVSPDAATLARYRVQAEVEKADRAALAALAHEPAQTRDGVEIKLQANLELPREIGTVLAVGADGIGLLRTEFLYMNRDDLPSEEEQTQVLTEIVAAMRGRSVTIRTLDIGGDKLAPALGTRFGEIPNPALGLRAIRLSLTEPRLLETQIAAVLRAGAAGPVRLLLPMITSVAEVRAVRDAVDRVVKRLRRRRVAFADYELPVGAMIEVPGAALIADALARESDFLAIGTNDLVMYTLAADRGDEAMGRFYDPLHPAVLRLVQATATAALRNRIPLSLCGEIAGDPRYTALLIGFGIRELSMSANSVLKVKRRVLAIDAAAAAARAQLIADQGDSGRIASLVDDFNEAL